MKKIVLFTLFFMLIALGGSPALAGKPTADRDGDGFSSDVDCNDHDASIYPGAVEICGDGIDQNCDGVADEGCSGGPVDADNDGYTSDVDCNDNVASINPGATEICGDGIDQNCDGVADEGCSGAATADPGTYTIFANNDLGIHCECFVDEIITILPPWNTVRAQILRIDGNTHEVVTDPNKITVEYSVPFAQEIQNDDRYQAYLDNINKTYPVAEGFAAVSRSNPVSIAGTALEAGDMEAKPEHNMWIAEGLPLFPPKVAAPEEGSFTDPLGNERQAYPQITITVKDAGTGAVLAERTDVTTPVAFANCCTCHVEIYKDAHGGVADAPQVVFRETVIDNHDAKQGTNLGALIDAGTPVRCSRCHSDVAVGGATPGYPVSLYPEAAGLNLPTSSKTLSYVIHEGHNAKGPLFNDRVTSLGFTNACEACHPNEGNTPNPSAQCLRGLHRTEAGLDCTSCHGTLADRTAQGQLDDPWSYRTLPRCSTCHGNVGEWTTAEIDSYGHQQFGGAFLNSRGHKNDIWLCTSCHGAPHAIAPSMMSFEQDFYIDFNDGINRSIGNCGKCHNNTKGYSTKIPH